ncbi:MAG: GDSL-type esterase/lipase family protein [Paludibacter sp.]|nr:GDSL-type esterase/lipase family protein [Paludibacter sp.]
MTKHFLKLKITFRFILIFSLLLASIPSPTSAYPAYTANSDLVIAGPYDTAASGSANWGITSGQQGNTSRDFITIGQKYRIRQNGSISRIRLYTVTTGDLTGFYLKIWRQDGSNYDLIGTSENLVSSLVSGNYATIDLATPLAVQEGDYVGYRMEATGNGFYFFARTSQTGVSSYLITNTTPSENDYNWTATPPNTVMSGAVLPIELYMTAPQVAFIGDSIIAGHPAHYSFLETTATTNINSTIEKQFGNLTGYTYQNMGIGSQETANISARFTADIINLKPKIVVIEGGVNDIAGSVAKSTFIANWTSILDAAQANSSITTIIVLKILPWTNGSTAQMQTRDDWNSSLATLAAGYSKAIVVDASSYVGQFRAGGDAGNLWDIQTAYNQDGVHFNQAGHTQIAQAIADNLPKPSATFDNDFSSWSSGNVTVNYNLIQTGGSTNTNISQTGSSGIEYSTDNSTWADATQETGGDGLTGLTSTASPGTDHTFVWDSTTDLPTTEDSTVYLRIRPNDGTTSAADWVTSNAFAVDNVAPSSVSAPTFGAISTSSIQITKPSTVTENGSGLYQWQARRNSSTELGYNATSTTSVSDSDLSPNTQYTYDAKFKDNQNNASSYGTQASKYTLIQTPSEISFDTITANSLTISASGTLSNLSSGSSGLYFAETSGNTGGSDSDWTQTNSYQNSGLSENTQYTFKVKARNGDGTETDYTTTSSKYTLADTPTNLSASSNSNSVSLSVDSFPNDTSGQSGYYFSRSGGGNSGWIQTNSWTDTGLSCGNSYTYAVKYRNGDGTETSEISTAKSTSGCGGGGMPAGWSNLPAAPTGGFKITVNQGINTTTNRVVTLNFNAGSDVKKMAVSMTGDFSDAGQEEYKPSLTWDLCSKMSGFIKKATCPDGQYTVYVKFYTAYGVASNVVSTKINLTTMPQFSTPAAPFTKNLYLNSKDSQVKTLQQFLNQNGYKLANSGVGSLGNETNFFGTLTSNALAKFQEANKDKVVGMMSERGFLGPITRQFINSFASSTTPAIPVQQPQNSISAIFITPLYIGLQSADVRRLQTLLATKPEIYPEGLITGYFGPLTRTAVQNFQLNFGVVASSSDPGFGYVGPMTRAKLQEVFGK